jgi:NitT/TauT family transport system substrate-binding protein
MSRRLFALLAIVPLVLAACGGSAGGPAGSASGAPANSTVLPVVALKIGYSNVTADDLALWVAKDAGMFAKNGIDAELVAINGGAQTMAALLAGQLNMGLLGGSEALSARAGDAELTVVATLAPVYPYFFMAGKNIKTFADLKGKKVGVSSIGGSADIATRKVLRVQGLDPEKDVTVVSLGSKAQRTAALLAGSVDAAVDDPPDSVKLESAGYHSIYDLALQHFPAANTALVIPTPWLNANRPVVQRVVDSIVQAIAYARKNKEPTIAIVKKYFGGEYEIGYDVAYDFFMKEVTPALPYPKVEQFADAKEELGKKNEKVKNFDVAKLLDESFVKSAADRGLDK